MSQLNKLQKEAVEYLEGPLLVLAGPGTGKTEILSRKVEYILKNTDASPSDILCLTYTEAGVTAMRERLISTRVEHIEQVTISTYHGFGSQVLAKYKDYAAEKLDRNFEKPIDNVTKRKIVKSIIESMPITDILRHNNSTDKSVQDVLEVISSAKSARLTAADLEAIAKINLDESEKIEEAIQEPFSHLVPRMKIDLALEQVYVPLADIIAGFTSEKPIVKNIYPEANSFATILADAIENAGETGKLEKLSAWTKRFTAIADDGRRILTNRTANRKLLSVAKVMAVYQEKLKENSQFDFADMIEEAIVALKTDSGFKATLQEHYQYVLLDEFQDTNPSQFEIVRLLTDYEKPCVMAVGDDDQAIYAFQGANASNLLDFANTYQAKIITLIENYRSTTEILELSHKIAEQIDDSFAKKHKIQKILTSICNNLILKKVPRFFSKEAAEVSLPERTASLPEKQKTYIARHEFLAADSEYAWVAEQVHKLIESGVEQKEIAIITPQHKYVLPLIPYLRRYDDVKICYEKRENILEDEQISELIALARFLNDLAEERNPAHKLLEILSFGFWELNPLETMNLIQGRFNDSRRALDFLVESEKSEYKSVASWISETALESINAPLEIILDKIVKKMSTSLIFDSERLAFYENLSVLREHLTGYLNTETPRLKDFISFVDDYIDAGEAILNTSPYRDSENAVQVTTAHSSKGLQFGYVFMIAVDNRAWGNEKGNNNLLTLPKNLESIRHTGIEKDEQLRLFFVAITRAKLGLIMTNSQTNFAGKTPHRLDYLREYFDLTTNTLCSSFLPNQQVFLHADPLPIPERLDNIQNFWISTYFRELNTANIENLKSRLDGYRLTASDLTSFIDIAYAGPLTFFERKVMKAPSEPASQSIHLGNLIHEVFEAVTNKNLDDDAAIQLFDESLEKLDLTDLERRDLKDRGHESLAASLDKFGSILRHKDSKAELNLSNHHLIWRTAYTLIPITGKIDHVHIDSENKTIEIYDFKTSAHRSERDWTKNLATFKYALQLTFYKLLLELSPEYKDYKITRGHILFVCPDNDNQVYDESFDFSDTFVASFNDLVPKVYKHMMTLDFVDELSPLHVFPDTTRKIKDIQVFIDLL